MPVTRIVITSGPVRKKPKAGDRRTTKKYGLQVRIPELHNGMYAVSNGRQMYRWCSPPDVPYRFRMYLTPQEQETYFPKEKS